MVIFAAVYTINIVTNLFQPLAKIVNVVLNITLTKIKMEELVKFVQDEFIAKKEFPTFGAGDTITVYYEIREGEKTRTQFFRGVVIQVKGTGTSQTFTIRKMSGTIGVERIFPINLPALQKIEINKKGDVRRKRIYYFRGLTGKKARIKEKRM
jgi:large subunit ribosomal protein L19